MLIYLAAHHVQTNMLAKLYPRRIGACIQPKHWGKFSFPIPYFLDNNGYSDFVQGKEFSSLKFVNLLEKCREYSLSSKHWPDFVVCPDRFNDSIKTRKQYDEWQPTIKSYGFKIAFVVQPGCNPKDVPNNADIIFTGGGNPFKYEAISIFKDLGKPIHVGGISAKKLNFCHYQGAVSGDSSGFFRGDQIQLQRLYDYLADSEGILEPLKTQPKAEVKQYQQLSLLLGVSK